MKPSFLIPLVLSLLLPCLSSAQSNTQHRKDSLRNIIAGTDTAEIINAYMVLTNIYYMESVRDDMKLDTLLALYREFDAEALRQERYKAQGSIRQNTLSIYFNRNEYDKVIELAPEYLVYLEKREVWQQYYQVFRLYLESYLKKGEYDKALDGAQRMYEEAKLREHDDGRGIALFSMSNIYGSMSRPEAQEKYLRECIGIIRENDILIGLTAQAYAKLCHVLIQLERFDEALQRAQEFEKINERYEELSKTKQTMSWINLWSVYQNLYINNREYDKAETYCDKIETAGASNTILFDVYNTRAQIFHSREQYGKALEMADKALEINPAGPTNAVEIMGLRLMILCAMRGVGDVYELFQQAANLRDSIRNTEFNAQLDELRTVYEVDKLEKENKIITIEKRRNRNYFLFALGGCILLSITLIIRIYYSRTIIRKNRSIYRKIEEQERLEEKLILPGDDRQRQLVARFHDCLLNDRKFTKPEINLDELISELATNRTYLFDAVKTIAEKTPMDYIHSMQLEEAKNMLKNHLELNIEIIAEGCGFNSRSTFYRLFRERYQMNPAEYRKIAKTSVSFTNA